MNQFSWSADELHIYEQEKKRELDAKAILMHAEMKGKAEGIKIGKAEVALNIAKQMLDEGFDMETVIKLTKLSKEEIYSIRVKV